jgi:hypothetical protein
VTSRRRPQQNLLFMHCKTACMQRRLSVVSKLWPLLNLSQAPFFLGHLGLFVHMCGCQLKPVISRDLETGEDLVNLPSLGRLKTGWADLPIYHLLSTYLSTYLSMYLSIYLCIYVFIYLPLYLSPIDLPTCVSIIYLLPIYLSVYLSIHTYIHICSNFVYVYIKLHIPYLIIYI